jgi:hypothetical protein
MATVLRLKEGQISKIIEFYQQQQQNLSKQIDELKAEFSENEQILKELKGNTKDVKKALKKATVKAIDKIPAKRGRKAGKLVKKGKRVKADMAKNGSYSSSFSWQDKVSYILKQKNKGLTIGQIFTELSNIDPSVTTKSRATLNSTLTARAKDKKGINREMSNGEYIYGLPDWFTENNQLIDQYRG